jgi:hypothetical protein
MQAFGFVGLVIGPLVFSFPDGDDRHLQADVFAEGGGAGHYDFLTD